MYKITSVSMSETKPKFTIAQSNCGNSQKIMLSSTSTTTSSNKNVNNNNSTRLVTSNFNRLYPVRNFHPYSRNIPMTNRSIRTSTAMINHCSSINVPIPIVQTKGMDTTTGMITSQPNTERKRIFSKELRCMMYGFGDDLNPYTESVDMIEDLVLQFITDVTMKALNFGANDRISIDDLLYILRKDPKKYCRLKELLDMNHELRQARKAFDEIKYIES